MDTCLSFSSFRLILKFSVDNVSNHESLSAMVTCVLVIVSQLLNVTYFTPLRCIISLINIFIKCIHSVHVDVMVYWVTILVDACVYLHVTEAHIEKCELESNRINTRYSNFLSEYVRKRKTKAKVAFNIMTIYSTFFEIRCLS